MNCCLHSLVPGTILCRLEPFYAKRKEEDFAVFLQKLLLFAADYSCDLVA
jgi:hypothetical protein